MQIEQRLAARFRDAVSCALQLHAHQQRKGKDVPYVAHLLMVAALAIEHGASEDEAIAAVLHDAVEDQGRAATRARIRALYGERVAAIVDGCTDTDVTPKPPWRERKEAHVAHLRAADASVQLVSACDKLANARELLRDLRERGPSLWKVFKGGRDGTLWYYREVLETLRYGSLPPALLMELEHAVSAMEASA